MPKKIIEREIVDEEESLSGSETTYEEPEVKPKKQTQPKKLKEPKQTKSSKKDLSLEDLVAIEINKRNRTANATKAKVEKADKRLIEQKIAERLAEAEKKRFAKQEKEKSIDWLVQEALSKRLGERNQLDQQIQYQQHAPPKLRKPRVSKPKPKAQRVPRAPKASRSQEVDYQEQPQYYPSYPQQQPQYYPQPDNSYRNLFM